MISFHEQVDTNDMKIIILIIVRSATFRKFIIENYTGVNRIGLRCEYHDESLLFTFCISSNKIDKNIEKKFVFANWKESLQLNF